ncbi:NAD(P)H dehydrogenase [Jeotgalibacillus alimentarius]|uniref:NAD(P)H dehydrogenase n=1 Tax=Jeotgalibacillus alimentarius TaxID=135826 RepID=A0A0C2VX94_9BACL|nr:NAD(P)H-dependent oxidoreductase [Jeotgalibacillus alimentarius]KIL53462.1 NAD(P)H dehydrogenase [Jeotgalibacillus alimentarius]
MKTTVIYAHPWDGSYNRAILDKTIEKLKMRNKLYQIIDLNKDNFNPALSKKDLSLFSRGETTDEKVHKYQRMLDESDEIVFIFPIWWFDTPAILKGFIDKVMLKGFAYHEKEASLEGLLTHIKNTIVITTSEVPTSFISNSIGETFINLTLKSIGLKNIEWLNCEFTTSSEDSHRLAFLDKVGATLHAAQ